MESRTEDVGRGIHWRRGEDQAWIRGPFSLKRKGRRKGECRLWWVYSVGSRSLSQCLSVALIFLSK